MPDSMDEIQQKGKDFVILSYSSTGIISNCCSFKIFLLQEYCELCSYRFSFTPIYSPDMPRRLPLRDVVSGLLTSVATAVHYWLHTTLVVLAWIGVVPIAACRIYRVLFSGSIQSVCINDFLFFSFFKFIFLPRLPNKLKVKSAV